MRSYHQARKAVASEKLEFFARIGMPGMSITTLSFGVIP
jgi:hypothetical protein